MGVINKLKGRMSGYNALTKGPAKEEDYAASTGFDDFGFKILPKVSIILATPEGS